MASGQVVGQIFDLVCPSSNPAQLTVRAGASTPAEQYTVWAFDSGTIEYIDLKGALRGYAGGGLTVDIYWVSASATSGVTRWGAAFHRFSSTVDIDTAFTFDYNDADSTAAGTSGYTITASITFTDGADMDSLANGEAFWLRIRRNASHANDTMTGDAQMLTVLVRET